MHKQVGLSSQGTELDINFDRIELRVYNYDNKRNSSPNWIEEIVVLGLQVKAIVNSPLCVL